MSEGVISARLLPTPEETVFAAQHASAADSETEGPSAAAGWDPQTFARQQIQGLVRQLFFSDTARPIRQVVFSAVGEGDLRNLCRSAGESLVMQTQEAVAVVGQYPRLLRESGSKTFNRAEMDAAMPLRQISAHVRANLWLVPDGRIGGVQAASASLHSYLAEVRRQFEYSIVQAPSAASEETTLLAQFADGIVVVVSEHQTRRAAACQIKTALEAAHVRILGAVLINRVFPIPEAIYRRL